MKKLIILSVILLCFISLIKAQPEFTISAGVKMIKPDLRTITLWYIDESPSKDDIFTDFNQTGNFSFQAGIRFHDEKNYKKLQTFQEIQIYLGSLDGFTLNAGLYYANHNNSKLRLQPELAAILGFCSKNIGTIENNDIYIQVNDTKFKDYSNVDVALNNVYLGLKPGLSFITKLSETSEIGIGLYYQLSAKVGRISFSGIDDSNNSISDYENLTESNVGFYVDGEKTEKIPFNPDGLEFKLFYSF